MFSLAELTQKMSKLNDWVLEGESIMKSYEFSDFKSALDFVNKVGEIAEKHNHHPDIFLAERNVRLILTTLSIKSLSDLDFKVAEEIDSLNIKSDGKPS